MVQWSKQAVLRLYKQLLNQGLTDLKYTDKEYYRNYIRKEFRKFMQVESAVEKQRQLNKGLHFLNKRRAVLFVAPDRLEQFTMEMKKNISEKPSKRSRRNKSPSGDSSDKSRRHRKRSSHEKDSKKSSSSSSKKVGSNTKRRLSSKSPSRDTKKYRKSSTTKKPPDKEITKSKSDSEFDPKELDLSVPIVPLSNMVKDREALLDTAFSIVQGPKLTSMLPDILKLTSVDEIKQLCSDQLKVMSSKRILHVMAGTEMESSSGTDSSDDERQKVSSRNASKISHQDHSLQTNHVDSTTSDHAGPCMLFPSAISTAKSNVADNLSLHEVSGKNDDDKVSTSVEPQIIYSESAENADRSPSDAEDGEVQSSSTSSSDEEEKVDVKVATSKENNAEEVLVEEIEEVEVHDEGIKESDDIKCEEARVDEQTAAPVSKEKDVEETQVDHNPDANEYEGKTQLEILELELRARAIRSLMKAAKTGKLKPLPTGN